MVLLPLRGGVYVPNPWIWVVSKTTLSNRLQQKGYCFSSGPDLKDWQLLLLFVGNLSVLSAATSEVQLPWDHPEEAKWRHLDRVAQLSPNVQPPWPMCHPLRKAILDPQAVRLAAECHQETSVSACPDSWHTKSWAIINGCCFEPLGFGVLWSQQQTITTRGTSLF